MGVSQQQLITNKIINNDKMATRNFQMKMLRATLPEFWEDKQHTEDGWCYLNLYDSKHRQKVAHLLGPFPTWGSIKELGGYRTNIPFTIRRTKDGRVHIASGGAGVSARYLPLGDSEIIGSNLWDRESVDYRVVLLFTLYMAKHLLLKTNDVLISLIGSVCVGIFTFYLMRGEVSVPINSPSISDLMRYDRDFPNRPYRRPVNVKRVRRRSLAEKLTYWTVIGLAVFKTVESKLLPSSGEVIKESLSDVSKREVRRLTNVLDPILKNYELCLTDSVDASELCCDDEDTRVMLLEADISDEMLKRIIDGVCDATRSAEDDWLRDAKKWLVRRKMTERESKKKPVEDIKVNNDSDIKFDSNDGVPNSKDQFMNSKTVDASRTLIDEGVDGIFNLFGEVIEASDRLIETVNSVVPEVYGSARRLSNEALNAAGKAAEIAGRGVTETVDRTSTAAIIVDDATTNVLYGVGEMLPSGEQIGQALKNSVEWVAKKSVEVAGGTIEISKEVAKEALNADYVKGFDETIDKIPKVAEKLGEAVGKTWYGAAKGAGVNVEKTILNPTPRNIRETMRAMFSSGSLFNNQPSLLSILSDSLTWMVAIVGGATAIYYLN